MFRLIVCQWKTHYICIIYMYFIHICIIFGGGGIRLDLVDPPLTGDFCSFCWIPEVFKWSWERGVVDSIPRHPPLIFLFNARDMNRGKLWALWWWLTSPWFRGVGLPPPDSLTWGPVIYLFNKYLLRSIFRDQALRSKPPCFFCRAVPFHLTH